MFINFLELKILVFLYNGCEYIVFGDNRDSVTKSSAWFNYNLVFQHIEHAVIHELPTVASKDVFCYSD